MQSIGSEEELARELASRGVSVFDDESGGFPPPDLYFHCGFLLLLAVVLLSSHVAIFSDFTRFSVPDLPEIMLKPRPR